MKLWRVAKLPIFTLSFVARTCHAWLARLTRARGKSSQREGNALFDDFWYFSSLKSTIKEKLLYASSRVVDGADPYKIKSKYNQQPKEKIKTPYAFSFAYTGAKEKAIKKKTPEGDFALRGARRGLRVLDLASL